MTIFVDTYMPYEYSDKRDALKYIESCAQGIKKSVRLIEIDSEHLTVKCPLSTTYIDCVGSEEEVDWLHAELTKRKWYRST